jgi:superfamily II DNA or RNA helicase
VLAGAVGGTNAVEWIDDRNTLEPIDLVPALELRDYQRLALDRMVTARQGFVVMPCGAGKTVTGIATICAIGQPALVIVHTKDLMRQWAEQIRDLVNIVPGQFGGGKKQLGEITVATVQTLKRLPAEAFDDLARRFGCVIVDEAHHTPASTFQDVLAEIPARYRFGLTATPTREDGLTPLLRMTLGDQLFSIDYKELVNRGHLEDPEIKIIETGFTHTWEWPEGYEPEVNEDGNEEKPDPSSVHQQCMTRLCEDAERNSLISSIAINDADDGHSILILSDRVEHCLEIEKWIWAETMMTNADHSCIALTGQTPTKDRAVILEAFKNGQIKILIATTLADEGLDVPRLSRVILAYPGKSVARTTQRLGRLMRPFPGKGKPVLYDFVDKAVPPLWKQARRRISTYRKLLEVEL